MEKEININELIQIKQLPQIFENLEIIGKWIDNGLAKIDFENLDITENNKQNLKNNRTEINKITETLETKRKELKNQILAPYKSFEKKYEEEIKDKLVGASEKLGNAINEIESKQKQAKEKELRQFFDNYNEDYHLEQIIKFEDVGLNITVTNSMKSLKDQIVDFFEKVNNDFMAIQNGEHKEDVLYEYKRNGFDYSKAVNSVNAKINAIKEMEQQLEKKKQLNEIEQNVVENVNTLVSAPIEIVNEDIIECEFKVFATKKQLVELKEYLKMKGIKYE